MDQVLQLLLAPCVQQGADLGLSQDGPPPQRVLAQRLGPAEHLRPVAAPAQRLDRALGERLGLLAAAALQEHVHRLLDEPLLREQPPVGLEQPGHLAGQLAPQPVLQELAELGVVAQALRLRGRRQVQPRQLLDHHRRALRGQPRQPLVRDRVEHRGPQQRAAQAGRELVEDLVAEVREERALGRRERRAARGAAQGLEDDPRRPPARRPVDRPRVDVHLPGLEERLGLVEAEGQLVVEDAAQLVGEEAVEQVDARHAPRDQHGERVGRHVAQERPQGAEGRGVRLEVVQVVEDDGPAGAQPLGQEPGAVLREQPVGEGVLDHRLEARLLPADRRRQVAHEPARRRVGRIEREPRRPARALLEEAGRRGRLPGPGAGDHQDDPMSAGRAGEGLLDARPGDEDRGERGRPQLGDDHPARAHLRGRPHSLTTL